MILFLSGSIASTSLIFWSHDLFSSSSSFLPSASSSSSLDFAFAASSASFLAARKSNAIPSPIFFRIGEGPPYLPPQRAVTAHLMQTFPPHLERKAHLSEFQGGLLAAHAKYVVDLHPAPAGPGDQTTQFPRNPLLRQSQKLLFGFGP
eukprot:765417-Hanusia_phi.AAC.3